MVLLMEGIDRLRSRRARLQLRMQQMRDEFRAKIREELWAEIREEVRQDIDDIVGKRLADLGIGPDTPRRQDTTAMAKARPVGLTEEDICAVVRECVRELGIKLGQGPTTPADG